MLAELALQFSSESANVPICTSRELIQRCSELAERAGPLDGSLRRAVGAGHQHEQWRSGLHLDAARDEALNRNLITDSGEHFYLIVLNLASGLSVGKGRGLL